MSADSFVQNLTDALFIVIFGVVAARSLHRPTRSTVDATLFFGALAAIIGVAWITAAANITPGGTLLLVIDVLAMALPYLLLRLIDDFARVPPVVSRIA